MKQFFLIVLSLTTSVLFAQDVAFKKGNFKDDKIGFEKAKANLKSGDLWLEKVKAKVLAMEYAANECLKALEFYLPAYEFNPFSSDLNRKLGHVYLYTNKPYKAMPFLKKSLENSKFVLGFQSFVTEEEKTLYDVILPLATTFESPGS